MSDNIAENSDDKPKEIENILGKYVDVKPVNIASLSPTIKNIDLTLIPVKQEETRTKLALYLIYTLIGTLFLSFVLTGVAIFSSDKENRTSVKDLITLVLTSQTGIIGTVLGFYFGTKDN